MAIITSKPVVVEAAEAKTYDKIWLKRLAINAHDMEDAEVEAVLSIYREVDGKKEASGNPIRFNIRNAYSTAEYEETQVSDLQAILADATTAQKLGLLVTAILDCVETIAKEKDLI